MPDQKYNRDTNRFDFLGLDLNRPLDSIKSSKFPYVQNIRAYQEGRIEPREGLQAIDSALDSASVHSIRRLNDPVNSSYTRIVGTGTLLGFGQVHFQTADTGYSGDPLALVPYRPEMSPQSWMYVADRNRMRKIDRTGNLHQIGLAWPMSPPTLATAAQRTTDISVPQYKVIDDFDATTGWAGAGTAGAPSLLSVGPGYRTTSTISQILYDSGTTGWASVALASMTGIGAGEDLTFNPGGGTSENEIVESVHAGAANVTIGSIIYDSGTSGFCSIVISSAVSASGFVGVVDVEALMRNTTRSENFRVLATTLGQDGNTAIRAYTVATFAAGDTVSILASFRVYLANNHAVGETVRTDGIRSAVTAGTGTLSKTAAFDLSLIAAGLPSQREDYMHISIRISSPAALTQIRILLDVDSTTNDFTQNYFVYTSKATDFTTTNLWQPVPFGQLAVSRIGGPITIQLTTGQVISGTINAAGNVADNAGIFLGKLAEKITIDGKLFTNAVVVGTTLIGQLVQPTGAGASQWTELRFRLADLDRFGTDATRTLANVAAIRIEIKATASVNIDLDSWWIGGGYGPDSGLATALPYLYRYRARIPSTGVRSNWSPAMRGGLTPKRQAIVVRLPQYPVPPGTTMVLSDIVLDVQRYGGQITEWHYVGTAENSAAVPFITDIYPDDTVARLPAEGQEFWQPWPIIGLPVTGPASGTSTASGTTLNDGATGFNPAWAPGVQIFVNGIPFTIYRVISTSRLETVESMGSIASVTWKVPEPTILAQPLPCLWGDDQLGVMFACGDTVNPGRLYWSNNNDPDTTKESNYLDITSSSEMLQNGVVYDGRAYQFSSERYFELLPDGQGGWRAIEVLGCRGLYSRWAITRNPTPVVCFLAKDGIYGMEGGAAKSLTDDDLYPLFPHEGNPGVSVNGVAAPVTIAAAKDLRLEFYDDYLYLDYSTISISCISSTASLGVAYSSTFAVIGGTGPYTFAVIGALPTGLNLNPSTGAVTGTPTVQGTFGFTVIVTDSAGSTGSGSCQIIVTSTSNMLAEVPIEMVDLGISSDTTATTFKRTLFRWTKSDYPAGSTFHIDVVGENFNVADQTVTIVDSGGSTIASLVIPANTTDYKLFTNLSSWSPSAADEQYRIKTPATTGVADVVIAALRIVVDVNSSTVPIVIPLSSAAGQTGLDQTSGGGDIFRTTSTTFQSLASLGWKWQYNASEWSTIASVLFSAVFTSAVVDGSDWGEVCLYDITASSVVVTLDNKGTPDTTPQYKDIAVSLGSLTDGHVYEPRIRRVGPTTFNTYFHKSRLQLNMGPWTKSLIPLRCGKAGTPPSPTQSRLKLPASTLYTPGAINSRFIESFGSTDPMLAGKGSYIADGGTVDIDGSFSNITASFLEYTSTEPSVPFRSSDISANLTAGNRYGIQTTTNINTQSQMLLWFKIVKP